MTRLRRLGAVVGGAAGLAVGLLLSLFISLLANLGPEGQLALLFISALSAAVGAAVGAGRAGQLERSLHLLATVPGEGVLRSGAIWPEELETVAHRLTEIEEARDAALAGQRFVQERLEAIVAGLRDGVMLVDSNLAVISINDAARAMFGVAVDSASGHSLIEITRDADLVRIASDAVERRTAQTTPVDYRRAGRQLNVRVQPIRQAGRRLAILVVQDITELRQLETVRRDFVANVSHELRTPLAGIRALIETLVDGAMHDETVADDFLNRVIGEVDRLNELIEDLLDLGRLESGRLLVRRSPIPVASLVNRAVERVSTQAEREGVAIRIEGAGEELSLSVDVSRMEQVLINLMDNAIKFSPRGGEVTLAWQKADAGVEIEVTDAGPGILPEDLPRIFERFYKSDRARGSSGTGLGLAIAKHIMAAHGGELTVSSVYGKGSTFTVRLPAAEISAVPSEGRAHPESRRPGY